MLFVVCKIHHGKWAMQNMDNEGMDLFLTKNDVAFIHFTYVKKLVTLGYGKVFFYFLPPLMEGPF